MTVVSNIADRASLLITSAHVRAMRVLHRNENGAEEGMNKLLIFALVALPLLALLIYFGEEIFQFADDQFNTVFGGGGVTVR